MVYITEDLKNDKYYDGVTEKFGITFNGIDYIVKYSTDSLSVFSEYIASRFINNCNVLCHRVDLGYYNEIVVDVIEDFTSTTGLLLHSFKDTAQSSEDTDISNKFYTYKDVIYLINQNLKIDNEEKELIKEQFWNMYICDAILANRDRHKGNWGYLSDGHKYYVAPIYDNGSCLYPNIDKVINKYIDLSTRREFLWQRVRTFPASLFQTEAKSGVKKTNYYEIFGDLRLNKTFARKVTEIRKNVSYLTIYSNILNVVNTIPDTILNVWFKRFYVEIVTLRYMCIVLRLDFKKSYEEIERLLQ